MAGELVDASRELTAAELAAGLDDPLWRLCNLYKIIVKGDDDDEDALRGEDDPGLIVTFSPRPAQRQLLARLWHRNLILKARQLGFTTLIALLWLDTALFGKSPLRCGIVAHDREAAATILRDKVLFAYQNLPDALREQFPLAKESAQELVFGHNKASIRVATSMRSGTIHRLHVSEFGKICAQYPHKAKEVVTGSIPAVPLSGIIVIESTAEGQEGPFHDMTQRALKQQEAGATLNRRDYRLHFFPWWKAPEYVLDPEGVSISDAQTAYFREVEQATRVPLSPEQRAWYAATVEADFAGDQPLMWQEYPSTPREPFRISTEGTYYAVQLTRARLDQRIVPTIPIAPVPVNAFWDLGRGDMTAIWLHQIVGIEHRFIGYIEDTGQDLDHYTKQLQALGLTLGVMYLPHEAAYRRLGESADTNRTLEEMVQALLPGVKTYVVPRVTRINAGIQATRNSFRSAWFDEQKCQRGLVRLAMYRKQWNKQRGAWSDEPLHDDASHGADAFRQWGQVVDSGTLVALGRPAGGAGRPPPHWRRRGSPMAV